MKTQIFKIEIKGKCFEYWKFTELKNTEGPQEPDRGEIRMSDGIVHMTIQTPYNWPDSRAFRFISDLAKVDYPTS